MRESSRIVVKLQRIIDNIDTSGMDSYAIEQLIIELDNVADELRKVSKLLEEVWNDL